MRAVVCPELGPPRNLRVEERPALAPGPGEVIVDVEACGVNFVDAMLGPTGNLRAPTIRSGKTVLVGFNEDLFSERLG